jgi:hypothetical protein
VLVVVAGSFYKEEHEQLNTIKILESAQWDRPRKHGRTVLVAVVGRAHPLSLPVRRAEDALLFRKLARCRFRIWHMNVDQGSLMLAREAYQRAFGLPENQVIAAMWAETAQVGRRRCRRCLASTCEGITAVVTCAGRAPARASMCMSVCETERECVRAWMHASMRQ